MEPLELRLTLDGAAVSGGLAAAGATGHPLQDFLRVTEIHYNPAAPSPSEEAQGFSDNDAFEFLELANLGGQTLDLGGVQFTEGIVFSFAGANV
ncbi:MAG: hypothetical protein NTW96_21965, partial [Planctomycetia bacterium]|nr:hypothetical protein [Planctomycetia bacterium]